MIGWGNIALTITIMGPTGTVDTDWEGPAVKALDACAQAVSKRLGYRGSYECLHASSFRGLKWPFP
jgi:hypothetical protein